LVKKAARKIIVMEQGKIVSELHSEDSLANLASNAQLLLDDIEDTKLDESAVPAKINGLSAENAGKSGKLVLEEERAVGRISRKTVFEYMGYFGNPFFIAGLWCAVTLGQAGNILNNWWIAHWSDAYARYGPETKAGFYLSVAAGIAGSMAVIEVFTSAFYQRGSWNAARALHRKLTRGVFSAPISWFDTTPVGRIVNRFAKDISSLDFRLLMWLQYVVDSALTILFRIGAVTSIMPVFALPAVFVAGLGYCIGEVYVRANIAVKRCQSITESPLFSHFGDSIIGAVTIRAYITLCRTNVASARKSSSRNETSRK
jgi:ABC-type multidrug transport system fused ATPase/permease subunit